MQTVEERTPIIMALANALPTSIKATLALLGMEQPNNADVASALVITFAVHLLKNLPHEAIPGAIDRFGDQIRALCAEHMEAHGGGPRADN